LAVTSVCYAARLSSALALPDDEAVLYLLWGGGYLKVPGGYVMKNILPSGGQACQVAVRLGRSYFVTAR